NPERGRRPAGTRRRRRRRAGDARSSRTQGPRAVAPWQRHADPRRPRAALLCGPGRGAARAQRGKGRARQSLARLSPSAQSTRMTMADPPKAAERLLRALLPPASVDTMTGDLLEEYRDTRVPAAGRRRADFWYARQVAGVFLRAYGW